MSIAQNIYGNNVTNRGSFLPSGAKKSWVEFEKSLPAGRLVEYYLYVNKITEINRNSAWIRIQIWRPKDVLKYQFVLVWERRVKVSLTDPNGLLYAVSTILLIVFYLQFMFGQKLPLQLDFSLISFHTNFAKKQTI